MYFLCNGYISPDGFIYTPPIALGVTYTQKNVQELNLSVDFQKIQWYTKDNDKRKITLKLINDIQFYGIEGRTFGEDSSFL